MCRIFRSGWRPRASTPKQIGIILSAPMFLRVVTTPLITAMADRAKDRAKCADRARRRFAAPVVRLFPDADLRASCLPFRWCSPIFWTLHSPLADSLALSGVRRFGSSYPAMRIWGSIAFLVRQLLRRHHPRRNQRQRRAGHDHRRARPLRSSPHCSRRGSASRAAPRRFRRPTCRHSAPKLLNRYFLLIVTGVGVINASHALSLRLRLDLLEVDRHRRERRRPALVRPASSPKWHVHGLHARFRRRSRRTRCLALPASPRSCAGSPFR